jgi:hypothetical protein
MPAKQPKIGDLFNPEPNQWGLRGDPFLWREMQVKLSSTKLPTKISKLVATVESVFKSETGHPLEPGQPIYVEKFAHGGMSSGGIDPHFWMSKGIPLLVQRFGAVAAVGPAHESKSSENQIDRKK